MGVENSPTAWVVGVCVLLAVGGIAVAGVGATAVSSGAHTADAPTNAETASANAGAAQQNGTTTGETNRTTTAGTNRTTTVTVPVIEAMATAANATSGTVVGAELEREGDVADLERPTMIYEVDVLLANGSRRVADVNATDGSLRGVEPAESGTGLFDEVFGSDDEVPSERVDPGAIRSAIEAVELVRNATAGNATVGNATAGNASDGNATAGRATVGNATVTSVRLTQQDGQFRYAIEKVSAEGIRSTAIVAADPDEGGVLTTDADGE